MEEMVRMHQTRNSAGASGAVSHGYRQQAEKLLSVLWARHFVGEQKKSILCKPNHR